MTSDPILDNLHATRSKLLDEAGGTLEGLIAAAQQRQFESGRNILSTKPMKPQSPNGSTDVAAGDEPPITD